MDCDETEYFLDYEVHVKGNFTNWFLNRCRRKQGEYFAVPVGKPKGYLKDDRNYSMPSVKYLQKDTMGCMFCGIASALNYFGDSQKGEQIMALMKDQGVRHSDFDMVIKEMQREKTHQYHVIKYKDELDDVTKTKYLMIERSVLLVVLEGSDGSRNHSVSICDGYIFDANRTEAMAYTKENFD